MIQHHPVRGDHILNNAVLQVSQGRFAVPHLGIDGQDFNVAKHRGIFGQDLKILADIAHAGQKFKVGALARQ